jgi:glycine betaine transporter
MPPSPDNPPLTDRLERLVRLPVDRVVLATSAAFAVCFVLWGILDNEGLASVTGDALAWVIKSFGWLFILASTGFVVLAVVLAFSRYGRIRDRKSVV